MKLKKLLNLRAIREDNPKQVSMIVTQSYINGVIDTLVSSDIIKIPESMPVKSIVYYVILKLESHECQDIIAKHAQSIASTLITEILINKLK